MSMSITPLPQIKNIWILTKVFWTYNPNLVIPPGTDEELWCGPSQNELNFYFQIKFDLGGQGQSPPQNKKDLYLGILHQCSTFGDPGMNGSYVVMRTRSGLMHKWADTFTDQTQAKIIPEGQNWPQIKIKWVFELTKSYPYLRITGNLMSV